EGRPRGPPCPFRRHAARDLATLRPAETRRLDSSQYPKRHARFRDTRDARRSPTAGSAPAARIEREAAGADPDRHDRLTQSDDDDLPETLREVRRGDPPSVHVPEEGAEIGGRHGRAPQRDLHRTVDEAGDQEQGSADDGTRDDPKDRPQQVATATARDD